MTRYYLVKTRRNGVVEGRIVDWRGGGEVEVEDYRGQRFYGFLVGERHTPDPVSGEAEYAGGAA